MEDSVIQARNFRKTYGDFVAVDGISFDVQQGEIFGLLGPNGSGKTSTLESLEGLRAPDGGTLQVAGVDPNREPRKLRNLIVETAESVKGVARCDAHISLSSDQLRGGIFGHD